MNKHEIALKSHLEQSEMEWLVMEYIKDMKGIDIGKIVYRGMNNFHKQIELQMLFSAFEQARNYYITKE